MRRAAHGLLLPWFFLALLKLRREAARACFVSAPDDLVIDLVANKLQQLETASSDLSGGEAGASRGWVLDGFPRTRVQARALLQLRLLPDRCVSLAAPPSLARVSVLAAQFAEAATQDSPSALSEADQENIQRKAKRLAEERLQRFVKCEAATPTRDLSETDCAASAASPQSSRQRPCGVCADTCTQCARCWGLWLKTLRLKPLPTRRRLCWKWDLTARLHQPVVLRLSARCLLWKERRGSFFAFCVLFRRAAASWILLPSGRGLSKSA